MSGDETHRLHGNFDKCHVFAFIDVRHSGTARALLQEQLEVFLAPCALIGKANEHRETTDVLDNAPTRGGKLATRGAPRSEGVRKFFIDELHGFDAPTFIGNIANNTFRFNQRAVRINAEARHLELDRTHHLNLGAASPACWSENKEFLVTVVACWRVLRLFAGAREEHERAPFLFEFAERSAAAAHHEAHAVVRHLV